MVMETTGLPRDSPGPLVDLQDCHNGAASWVVGQNVEMHRVGPRSGIIQYGVFWGWHLSLSIMFQAWLV